MNMNADVKRMARKNARSKSRGGGADYRATPVPHAERDRNSRQDAADLVHDLQMRLRQIVRDVLNLLRERGYPGATVVELYVPRRLLLHPFRRNVRMGGWVIGYEIYHHREPANDEDTIRIGHTGHTKTAKVCLTSDGRIVLPRRDLPSVVIDPFRPRRYKRDPSGNHWKVNHALRRACSDLHDFRLRLLRGWQVEELPTTHLEPSRRVTPTS